MSMGGTSRDARMLRDLARLARLRPIDDDFMRCLFQDDLPLAQEVLRIITGITDLTLLEEETQRDLKRLVGARSVELDVWGRDSAGRLYDLEVQRGEDARPRRARYCGSAMDVEALDAGDDFEDLPETYVIFLMEHDPFGAGLGTYTVERVNLATGDAFDDGLHVLYANASYRGDDELGALMHDFCQSDPDQMSDGLLARKVRHLKEDPEGVARMCEIMEEIRAEGVEEGRKEGRKEGRLEAMATLVREGMLTAKDAAARIGVTEAELSKVVAML